MPNDAPPLVSIVLACYIRNREQAALLEETLATIREQSFQNYELIVVDDGSPVDVAAIVSKYPRTTTLGQANAGPAIARNAGIARARGEYFVFIDADDYLLPGALEASLRAFAEHPECGFVIGRREEMNYDGSPVPWGIASMPRETHLYDILLGFDWYIIPPSSAMFRRATVERIGGFRDPWGADDLDFYLRAAREFQGWCFEEPPVTRYRRYSASSSRDGERMLRSIRAVYQRQLPVVRGNPASEAAYERGLSQLTEIFRDCLLENLEERWRERKWRRAIRAAWLLLWESPARLRKAALAGFGRPARAGVAE